MEQISKIPHFKAWVIIGSIIVILATLLSVVASSLPQKETIQSNSKDQKNEQNEKNQNTSTLDTGSPSASSGQHVQLAFSEKFIDASKSDETVTVDILLNTKSAITNGAYIEVVYDPESLSEVELMPAFDNGSLYGESADVTTLSHSPQDGKFVLGVATSAGEEGNGRIATLSFKPLKSSSKDSTQITFSSLSEGYSSSGKYPADPDSIEIKIK